MIVSAWLEHAPFAFWLTEALRPRVFVELGAHYGFSYLVFCQAVQRCDLSTRCYAIDTWEGDEHAGFYGNDVFMQLHSKNEEAYSAFSRLMRMRFDQGLPYFADHEVDLLHIDGRHTYEDALEDFTTWLPKVSDRGVVLFHDTNVRERDFGVWKLWQELCEKYPHFEFFHGNGLGVLAVGSELPEQVRELFQSTPEQASVIRQAYSQLGSYVTQRAVLEGTHAQAMELRQQLAAQAAESEQMAQQIQNLNQLLDEYRRNSQEYEESIRVARQELQLQEQLFSELDLQLKNEIGAARAAQEEKVHVHAQLAELHQRQQFERQEFNARIASYELSIFWRITKPLRALVSKVRPETRLTMRRIAKGVWWLMTPQRLPARMQFLAQRKKGGMAVPALPAGTPAIAGSFSPERLSWFDPEWYLEEYPDVAKSGMDPYQHFVQIGWKEQRNPHPLFDTGWYLQNNPKLLEEQEMPLMHFCSTVYQHIDNISEGAGRGWELSRTSFGDLPSSLPIAYAPPGRGGNSRLPAERFFAQLDEVEVLSLDIFDTALFRRVGHPTTVFELLGERFNQRFPNAQYKLADIRFWAEREARKRSQAHHGSQEISIHAIYEVIRETLGLGQEETAQLMRAELEEERAALRANPQILAWAMEAVARGKRLIFISDMYLPSEFLREILAREGFPAGDVFVSCEHAAGKWEEKLFQIALKKCGIPGHKVLHVGDNIQSDKLHAERAGLRAQHYPQYGGIFPYALQLADISNLSIENVAVSVTLGLSHVHHAKVKTTQSDWKDKLAKHIGYEVLGPTVLGFAAWIAGRTKDLKVDRALFLARDGLLPSEAYKRIRALDDSLCEARYIAASRRLLYSTNFESEADVLDMAQHIHFSKDTTLEEYLDIYQLTNDEIMPYARKFGFHDIRLPIMGSTEKYGAAKARLMKLVQKLAPLALQRAQQRAALLNEYYACSADIGDRRKVAIIDLGWAGSLVKPLNSILKKINGAVQSSALFFGLNSYANTAIPKAISASAYFFDRQDAEPTTSPFTLPSSDRPQDIIAASLALVEVLISANHTTIIGLERHSDNDSIVPIMAVDSYTEEQRHFLKLAHEECMAFVEDAIPLLPRNYRKWNFKPVISQAWKRLLASPSEDEATLLGAFPHRADASGHAANTTLISSPEHSADKASLWQQFTHSMWPNGWFALLDPAVRARMLSNPRRSP